MIEVISAVVFLSLVVERLIEVFVVKDKAKPFRPLFAAVLGVALAVQFNTDLFFALGLYPVFPIISVMLTGVVIGGGSHLVHDLLSYVNASKDVKKEEQKLWADRNGEAAV